MLLTTVSVVQIIQFRKAKISRIFFGSFQVITAVKNFEQLAITCSIDNWSYKALE